MSGRKSNLRQFHNISSGDMSLSSITSVVTNIQQLDNIGLQLNWTGSPVGLIAIQVSMDYAQDAEGNVQVAGNWTPLIFTYWNGSAFVTSASIPTSVGSPIYLDIPVLSAPWIRVVYTKSSGSGTLDGYISAKSL